MSTAIRAEGLSKSYIISHQQREPYVALRDVLAARVHRAWSRLRHPFHRRVENDGGREEFWALRDVSFEVQQGDRIGIIGRNGAGKSTLLKVLSRITEPTTGRLAMRGRVASLLEVGTGFHPELTGRENIFLNGAILGMSRSEITQQFDRIVDFAEVERFLDTPVKRYSSGMYVRLAFAVAAHLEPEILIIDEVLAVGDSQFQKKCIGKMEEVGEDGRTVLFVSHNVGLIRTLCSRGILLQSGRVRLAGDVEDVVQEYQRQMEPSSEDESLFPLHSHNSSVDVLGFDWQRSDGAATTVYSAGEVLNWTTKIRLLKRPKQFNVVVALENEVGQRVVVFTSSPSVEPDSIPTDEEVELNGTFSGMHLAPGRYTVAFGIRVNDETVLYVPQLNLLNVIDSRAFPGQNGIVRVDSTWDINRPSHAKSASVAQPRH